MLLVDTEVNNKASTADRYWEDVKTYTRVDGVLSILVIFLYAILLFIGMQIYMRTNSIVITVFANVVCIAFIFGVLYLRKQKLSTVGINNNSWIKSSLIGL